MAVLAFKADTQCAPYTHLFDEDQWQSLVELFYQELYRLNNLTPHSVLAVHLQVRLCRAHVFIIPASAGAHQSKAMLSTLMSCT